MGLRFDDKLQTFVCECMFGCIFKKDERGLEGTCGWAEDRRGWQYLGTPAPQLTKGTLNCLSLSRYVFIL